MGRTRPKCMGWAGQARTQTGWLLCISTVSSPSLFAERELIQHSNQPFIICRTWINSRSAWRRSEYKQREAEAGQRDGVPAVASRRCCWRRRHGGRRFSFSLSPLFFVLFSADSLSSSFFRFFFLFLSSLYPLSCNPSPSLPLLFFFPSPVFIGKKQGRRHGGAATVGHPLHYRSMDKKEEASGSNADVLLH